MQVVDVRNRGTLAGLGRRRRRRGPGRGIGTTARRRSLSRRWRRSCSASSSTSPPTSGWRPRAASRGDRETARLALLAQPARSRVRAGGGDCSIGCSPGVAETAAADELGRAISCSPSTAADSRPISRWSPPTGRLRSFVRGGTSRRIYLGVEGCIELLESLLADAVARPASTSPIGHLRCDRAAHARRRRSPRGARVLRAAVEAFAVGRAATSSTTTRSRCCGPGPTAGGESPSSAAAGINCVGRAPDGREVRFPSLGFDHR